ncbi:MAG: SMI1/KNR4 family protein [Phycisphaerales bacterium]|nr:SMI1/KNR4 family protein [Phycisphaerales bacterium]
MHWREAIAQWARAVEPHAARPVHLQIGPPADPGELRDFERGLDRPIPAALRRFLAEQAGEVNFWWDLRKGVIPLDVPEPPNSGYMEFSLDCLAIVLDGHAMQVGIDSDGWIPNRWRAAFPFLGCPNGDAYAFDLHESETAPPIIYLSHEEPELHTRFADSFEAFLQAWFSLGCVGNESWVLRHFVTDGGRPLPDRTDGTPTSRLDPTCPNARQFRAFFGMG